MKRFGFLAGLAALAAAPHVPVAPKLVPVDVSVTMTVQTVDIDPRYFGGPLRPYYNIGDIATVAWMDMPPQ